MIRGVVCEPIKIGCAEDISVLTVKANANTVPSQKKGVETNL